jgi:hypothetical protein
MCALFYDNYIGDIVEVSFSDINKLNLNVRVKNGKRFVYCGIKLN